MQIYFFPKKCSHLRGSYFFFPKQCLHLRGSYFDCKVSYWIPIILWGLINKYKYPCEDKFPYFLWIIFPSHNGLSVLSQA